MTLEQHLSQRHKELDPSLARDLLWLPLQLQGKARGEADPCKYLHADGWLPSVLLLILSVSSLPFPEAIPVAAALIPALTLCPRHWCRSHFTAEATEAQRSKDICLG